MIAEAMTIPECIVTCVAILATPVFILVYSKILK